MVRALFWPAFVLSLISSIALILVAIGSPTTAGDWTPFNVVTAHAKESQARFNGAVNATSASATLGRRDLVVGGAEGSLLGNLPLDRLALSSWGYCAAAPGSSYECDRISNPWELRVVVSEGSTLQRTAFLEGRFTRGLIVSIPALCFNLAGTLLFVATIFKRHHLITLAAVALHVIACILTLATFACMIALYVKSKDIFGDVGFNVNPAASFYITLICFAILAVVSVLLGFSWRSEHEDATLPSAWDQPKKDKKFWQRGSASANKTDATELTSRQRVLQAAYASDGQQQPLHGTTAAAEKPAY